MPHNTLKAASILKALVGYYENQGFLCFPEFRMGTGWRPDSQRRLDLFAIHPHESRRLERIAFEIKISISDMRREIANAQKRRPALLLANKFYFVAPPGVIRPEQIPIECGLKEVSDEGHLKTIIAAPWFDNQPNWVFVASFARRVAELEKNRRPHGGD